MGNKRLIRLLSFLMAFFMILPSVTMAMDLTDVDEDKAVMEEFRQDFLGELAENETIYENQDSVRVVIELDEEPVIVRASRIGLNVNDMSQSMKYSLERAIDTDQSDVRRELASSKIDFNLKNSFNTVFNGFSGEIEFKDIETIEKISGVKDVYIAGEYKLPEIRPNTNSGNDLVYAGELWDMELKGEGTLVAIIDSGGDPYHRDMVVSDGVEVKYNEAKMEDKIRTTGLSGKYYNSKVPYAYNYYDINHDVNDTNKGTGMHGMHVAGIVGANGDLDKDGVKGVAPECQLAMMKVFSNDPVYGTTFVDIYLKAMDDAIKLGADSINISIGADAAFNNDGTPASIAVSNVVENGIVCAISAGNSGHISYGYDKPLKENPDIGVVGAPGIARDSLQVASLENITDMLNVIVYEGAEVSEEELPNNTVIIGDQAYSMNYLNTSIEGQMNLLKAYKEGKDIFVNLSGDILVDIGGEIRTRDDLPESLTYYGDDGNGRLINIKAVPVSEGHMEDIVYETIGDVNPKDALQGELEFIDCGLCSKEELSKLDLRGKVALTKRGELDFIEKIRNAQVAGAKAVIIYNHEEGGEELLRILYPWDGKIPAVFIGNKGGGELLKLDEKKLTFSEELKEIYNPNYGQMSEFTSWGANTTLDFKPEITAPGGKIYSTLEKDKYGIMSGTSMSSPQVAGGAALVKQYIRDHEVYGNFSPEGQARLIKLLLMNTADILECENEKGLKRIVSPRRQGAGNMNLRKAIATDVTVMDRLSKEGSVALKDFQKTNFDLDLVLENYSKEDLEYEVKVKLLTDEIEYDEENEREVISLSTRDLTHSVTGVESLVVAGGAKKDLKLNIDFSSDDLIDEDSFVEGYVVLREMTDTKPEISIPFMGFYGDWAGLEILDGMSVLGEYSFYEVASMVGAVGTERGIEIVERDEMIISPYTDDGKDFGTSLIIPGISLLRNAKELEFNILDRDNNKLQTLHRELDARKDYYDANPYKALRTVYGNAVWDGKVGDKIVEDGLYNYEIRAKAEYPGAKWQSKIVPILVDSKKPEIFDVTFNEDDGMLEWSSTDSGSGLRAFRVTVNGKQAGGIYSAQEDLEEYGLDLSPYVRDKGSNIIKIYAIDGAMNVAIHTETYVAEEAEIELYIFRPGLYESSQEKMVFAGYVFGTDDLESVTVDGVETELMYMENLEIPVDPSKPELGFEKKEPGYQFGIELEFTESGSYAFPVTARTKSGKEKTLIKRFLIDCDDPELEVELLPREIDSPEAEISISMKDNFRYLELYIGDEIVYKFDETLNGLESFEPVEVKESFTVPLELGTNRVRVVLKDLVGNQVAKFITVKRVEK